MEYQIKDTNMENIKEIILTKNNHQVHFVKSDMGFYNPVKSSNIPATAMIDMINNYKTHDYNLHIILKNQSINISEIIKDKENDYPFNFFEESINKASCIILTLENEDMGTFRILSDYKTWIYTNKCSQNFTVDNIYKEIEFMKEQGCEIFFIDRTEQKYID